jgi:hypothetical protein
MWRYLVGGIGVILLATAGVFWWKAGSAGRSATPSALFSAPASAATAVNTDDPLPPQASDKTREEKRFSRYDKDKDGKVAREEYLAARRKAFAKLDLNGDGKLSFDEWAAKAIGRFDSADADKSGALSPPEFTTTKIARKTARPRCDPAPAKDGDDN